MLIEKYLIFN